MEFLDESFVSLDAFRNTAVAFKFHFYSMLAPFHINVYWPIVTQCAGYKLLVEIHSGIVLGLRLVKPNP